MSRLRTTLLSSVEGCVLLAGIALAAIYIGWLAIQFLIAPDYAQILVGLTAIELMFGRAAGMAFGYSMGLGHIVVIPVCIILETIFVLIFYPLFVFSCRQLLVFNVLKNVFERIHQAAVVRQKFVRRYGVIGLFAFVWFPFYMTGPGVGSIIGYLLEMPVWMNLTAVLSGTYIAIFCWGVLLHTFSKQMAEYSSYAAEIMMAVLLGIIIIGHLLQRAYHNNKTVK